MKIELLIEQLSQILYHSTDVHTALKIIEQDKFKLSSTLAKQSEKDFNKKLFYLSTTRSKLGNYHQSSVYMLVFTLNGSALNNVVGGHAVDYWGRDFRKENPARNEMEDRIVSDRPVINNASKYIISVDLYVSERYLKDNFTIAELAKACMDHHIQINLYKRPQDFYLGKNAISNEAAYDALVKIGPKEKTYQPRQRESDIAPYIELIQSESKDNLSEKAQRVLREILYYTDSAVRILKADFHNENKSDDSRTLTLLAKRLKITSLSQIIDYIKQKYTP